MDDMISGQLSKVLASAIFKLPINGQQIDNDPLERLNKTQRQLVENATTSVLEVLREAEYRARDPERLSDCGMQSTKTDHNGTAQFLWEQRSTRKPCLKIQCDQIISNVKDFIFWVANNDFEDPENIFVCAEWCNLCASVNIEPKIVGEDYRKRVG